MTLFYKTPSYFFKNIRNNDRIRHIRNKYRGKKLPLDELGDNIKSYLHNRGRISYDEETNYFKYQKGDIILSSDNYDNKFNDVFENISYILNITFTKAISINVINENINENINIKAIKKLKLNDININDGIENIMNCIKKSSFKKMSKRDDYKYLICYNNNKNKKKICNNKYLVCDNKYLIYNKTNINYIKKVKPIIYITKEDVNDDFYKEEFNRYSNYINSKYFFEDDLEINSLSKKFYIAYKDFRNVVFFLSWFNLLDILDYSYINLNDNDNEEHYF